MAKKTKLPKDTSQKAKRVVDIATRQLDNSKNAAAVELGKKGGKIGGPARAKKLSAKRRKEIAQQAAAARWHKH